MERRNSCHASLGYAGDTIVVDEVGILEPLSLDFWTTALSFCGGTLPSLRSAYAKFITQRSMQAVSRMDGVEGQAVKTTLRLPLRY